MQYCFFLCFCPIHCVSKDWHLTSIHSIACPRQLHHRVEAQMSSSNVFWVSASLTTASLSLQILKKEEAIPWPGTLAIVHSYIAYKEGDSTSLQHPPGLNAYAPP